MCVYVPLVLIIEYTYNYKYTAGNGTSGHDAGIGEWTLPPCTTTAKITTRLQNKYHPDSSENQAIWKSDNQGFKEATFTQTCRMGGDTEAQRGT